MAIAAFGFAACCTVFFVWGLRLKQSDPRTKERLKWLIGGDLWNGGDAWKGWRMRLYSMPLGIAMGLFGGIALLVRVFTRC